MANKNIKFKDHNEKNQESLPAGNHRHCRLESVDRHEPDEELFSKYPDMKPYLCFRFVLHDPKSEYDGFSAVRFCNETDSKLGALYAFCTDLNGGQELEEFDRDQFVDKWFDIRVKKRPKSDKLHVVAADPYDGRVYAERIKDGQSVDSEEANGKEDTDEGMPF